MGDHHPDAAEVLANEGGMGTATITYAFDALSAAGLAVVKAEDHAALAAEVERLREERAHLAAAVRGAHHLLDGGPPCDLHRGKPDTDPDKVTYCFTCHENYPCWGEDVRAAAGLLRAAAPAAALTEEDRDG